MRHALGFGLFAALALAGSTARAETDLCAGKKVGTATFYDQEISRDKPLPKPVTTLEFGGKMFALVCLTDGVGPQASGGEKFRIVLWVKPKDGDFRQKGGIFRPQLSKKRKDIIVSMDEVWSDDLKSELESGEYDFRLQAATEKPTGTIDVELNFATDTAYVQKLRKAGYVADARVHVVVK